MSSVKLYKAWFLTDFSIEQIGEMLVAKGVMTDYNDDIDEDNYEWVEGQSTDKGISFNIWRKLSEGEYWNTEPVNVYCLFEEDEPEDSLIENTARVIATTLGCEVSLGNITNVINEDYEYKETDLIPV